MAEGTKGIAVFDLADEGLEGLDRGVVGNAEFESAPEMFLLLALFFLFNRTHYSFFVYSLRLADCLSCSFMRCLAQSICYYVSFGTAST